METKTPKRIALLGECMIELQGIPFKDITQTFGGDTLNTAVYLSRLGKERDIEVSYLTALGDDFFSKYMLEAWANEGINTDHVRTMPGKRPGLYFIELDGKGERSFHYWRGEAAVKDLLEIEQTDEYLQSLHEYDVIYLSGISLAVLKEDGRNKLYQFLNEFRAFGKKVVFDNNYRPLLWKSVEEAQENFLRMLKLSDVALLTFDDEVKLFGDTNFIQTLERAHNCGVHMALIKRGSEDCIISYDNETFNIPARKISNVVDTTAAGDSFSAGFLAAYFSGESLVESVKLAHELASIVIQHKGAVIDIEHMEYLL